MPNLASSRLSRATRSPFAAVIYGVWGASVGGFAGIVATIPSLAFGADATWLISGAVVGAVAGVIRGSSVSAGVRDGSLIVRNPWRNHAFDAANIRRFGSATPIALKGVRTLAVVTADTGKVIPICGLTAPRGGLITARVRRRFDDITTFAHAHHIRTTDDWAWLTSGSRPT